MKHIIQSLFILLFMSTTLQATTVIKLSLDQMIQKASAIVHASVIEIKSQKNNAKIVTTIQFQTIEQFKGEDLGQTWTLTQVGGTIAQSSKNQITQKVLGQAHFEEKEEVLVFLEKTQNQEWVVLGLSQGKYKIETQTHLSNTTMYQSKQASRDTSELGWYQSTETVALDGQITNIDSFDLQVFKEYVRSSFQPKAIEKIEKIEKIKVQTKQLQMGHHK